MSGHLHCEGPLVLLSCWVLENWLCCQQAASRDLLRVSVGTKIPQQNRGMWMNCCWNYRKKWSNTMGICQWILNNTKAINIKKKHTKETCSSNVSHKHERLVFLTLLHWSTEFPKTREMFSSRLKSCHWNGRTKTTATCWITLLIVTEWAKYVILYVE